MIAVGRDEPIATFEPRNIRNFSISQIQRILYAKCFVILQIENDFCLSIIDDSFTVLAPIQAEKVVEVLCCSNSGTTVSPDDLEYLQTEFGGQGITPGTNHLPDLINEDCFLLGSIFFRFIPHEVQHEKHTNSQQFTRQLRNIKNCVGIGKIHIGLLIEGLG